MQKYNPEGLRACLKEFDEGGKTASCGKWKIARGGYDLNWELYYDNEAVMQCIGKRIRAVRSEKGNSNFDDVMKTVMEVYTDLSRKFDVTCTAVYNGEVRIAERPSSASAEDATAKAAEMLNSLDDSFPGGAHIGEAQFVFGEATADGADECGDGFIVTCTAIYNGHVSVYAADEDEAIGKAQEMLRSNDNTFPGEAHIGGISFSFGEATADFADEDDCD